MTYSVTPAGDDHALEVTMSRAAHRASKKLRPHTLCFEYYRAERNCRSAQVLAESPPARAVSPFGTGRPALTPERIAHRRRMLAHLAS